MSQSTGTNTSGNDYIQQLLDNNQAWSEELHQKDPQRLERDAVGQSPKVLWIGCSDSRVPPTTILKLGTGDVFVHRNLANVVSHTDMSVQCVIQYAVDALKVEHIIVCGHTCCGAIAGAMDDKALGVIDHWLRPLKDEIVAHESILASLPTAADRQRRMVEINVAHSVRNIVNSTVIQGAWRRGQPLSVHGWCYDVGTGRCSPLGKPATSLSSVTNPLFLLKSPQN
ncbi:MAG: carbonic anhydrase [Piptocephalis tieghemiana]|nr:MAG: carbonic anhydrase [Piptocephalis tieghemiana]